MLQFRGGPITLAEYMSVRAHHLNPNITLIVWMLEDIAGHSGSSNFLFSAHEANLDEMTRTGGANKPSSRILR